MTEQIAITEEAKKLIAEELRSLAEELEKEAIAEALRSRGRPVEVTASDVRRARIRFVKRDRPLLPVTDLLLRAYLVLGVSLCLWVASCTPLCARFFLSRILSPGCRF